MEHKTLMHVRISLAQQMYFIIEGTVMIGKYSTAQPFDYPFHQIRIARQTKRGDCYELMQLAIFLLYFVLFEINNTY